MYKTAADIPDGVTVFSIGDPYLMYRRYPKAIAGKEYELTRLDQAKGPLKLVTEHQVDAFAPFEVV